MRSARVAGSRAAMALLLALVAGIAGYLPARRASGISPIAALRGI